MKISASSGKNVNADILQTARWILMKQTLIFISYQGLQHIQTQKNSKMVGYIDCLYYI